MRTAAGVALLLVGIEVLARRNDEREQAARAYLGDQLFTEAVGMRGDPIVFIAGLQASTRYWNHAFDSLAATQRVIYVDLLGFGRSPWPDSGYTLDDQVAALHRTLARLGATKNVTLVAHSFGTIIAAEYAARHPQEVTRLVLLGAPVYDSEAEARERLWDMSPMAAAFTLQPVLAREGCKFHEAFRGPLRRLMPYVLRRLPPAVAEDTVEHTWPSIRGAIDILLHHPIRVPLRSIGPKTTLVHGRRDTVTSASKVDQLARETGATFVEVAGEHHDYVGDSTVRQIVGRGKR